jgi:hypothetical protein
MSKTKDEAAAADALLMTRWIDGRLTEAEASDALSAHPEWAAEKRDAEALGDALRASCSLEGNIPYADFFNHQVRRRISEEDAESAQPAFQEGDESVMRFPVFQRLRWLAGAGFLIMLGILITMATRQPADRSEVVSLYTPLPGARVSAVYESGAGATVIRLEGLEPLSEAVALVKAETEAGKTAGSHVIYSVLSTEIGRRMSLLAADDEADDFPRALLVQF